MIGRNDLCTCGSGKKYKKCCLNNDKQKTILINKLDVSQKYDMDLSKKLFEYSRSEKFNKEYLKAKDKFFIVDDIEVNKKFNNFFNTYYIQDYIARNNKSIGVLFYEENREKLSVIEKNILKNRLNSYTSAYEVVEINEDKAVLKDILLDEYNYVNDLNMIKALKVGEIIIGRIAKIAHINKFIDTVCSISTAIKNIMIKDINDIYASNKNTYKDIKHFLIYNTNLLYRYIQQLLDPKIGEYLKKQKNDAKYRELDKNKEYKCGVEKLIKEYVEDDYLEVALTTWEEYKNTSKDIKGSESGWASALEYHIKKEKGLTVTQGDLAKKYKVSPSTLGKRYKEIKEIYQKIV